MDLIRKVLLLFGNFVAIFAIPIIPPTRDINEAISEIISDYNSASAGKYIYRLFQTEDQEVDSAGSRGANFTIKETVCLKSQHDYHQTCAHKPHGAMVKCVARSVTAGSIKAVAGRCHPKSNKHLLRRDLSAAIQGDTRLSQDTEKVYKPECLECIFTLIPTPPT